MERTFKFRGKQFHFQNPMPCRHSKSSPVWSCLFEDSNSSLQEAPAFHNQSVCGLLTKGLILINLFILACVCVCACLVSHGTSVI